MDSHHPYAKFIHAENQDILWGLYKKSSKRSGGLETFFRREIRNYYVSHLVSSGKPCSTVRDLYEINRDALAYLMSSVPITRHEMSEIPIGINVVEEKKRLEEMHQDRFANYASEYHQLLARPAPKIDAVVPKNDGLNEEKIKNMDELLERQMQARKEDELRIAALMKPPSQAKPLKIDYGSEKSVSWDPMLDVVVEVVNI